ncbi:MAG: hypothetical protein Q7K40_02435 [bacterium]|nr:hypothetical protein [bacterium]
MKSTQKNESLETTRKGEIEKISSILGEIGFSLKDDQPHLSGERYLMTKDKLVLLGEHIKNNERVIIKTSKHPNGRKEIETEKNTRDLLKSLSFTKKNIMLPAELYYAEHDGFLVWITSYVPQEKVFVAHTLEEQFFLALRAFEAQEAFHAATFEHLRTIKNTFPVFDADKNVEKFEFFKKKIEENFPNKNLSSTLETATHFLKSNKPIIDRYSRYLVHQDFVPHNFRIKNSEVYMLDCSAVYFSNKYEGWARFLNYMLIHNPKLEKLLTRYILDNRGEEEYLSLRLMRVLKVAELLEYYTRSLKKTEGNLRLLTEVRIEFWHDVLKALPTNKELADNIRSDYLTKRDSLRSVEEKERQREFALA